MKGIICIVAVVLVLLFGAIATLRITNNRAEALTDKEYAIHAVRIVNRSSWQGFWVDTPLMDRKEYGQMLDRLAEDFRGNQISCRIEIASYDDAVLEQGSVKLYLSSSYTQEELLRMLLEVRRFYDFSELAERKYTMGYSNGFLGLEKVNDALELIVKEESKDCKIILGRSGDVSEGWRVSAVKIKAEPGGYAEVVYLPMVMLGVYDDLNLVRQKLQEFLAGL